ncbi:hypothetical protein ACFY3G_00265 [Streptomyces phaeochromogenes]|uniref:hypothetical protein n=1 Tax=Streptomyces phaeochromogenes TaxID=1923 RepID=UPI0036D0F790
MAEQRGPDDPSNLPAPNPSDLGELLAAAVRGGAVDGDAERRVLAAFRAARDEGAHRASARNRRRDDWRPERERRGGQSVRTTLVASLALGGVAVAAIGSAGGGTRDEGAEQGGPLPASSAPTGPPAAAPNQSAPAQADRGFRRPTSAQDTEAHCRAYDSVKKHGKKRSQALDSTAWQRLIQAAGGAENVEAYCAEQQDEKKEKKKEKGNAGKVKPSKSPQASKTSKASKTPGSGATKNSKSKAD